MPLINVLIVLVVVGLLLWLANNFVPMAAPFKKILNIVAVVLVILWLLRVFGILSALSGVTV